MRGSTRAARPRSSQPFQHRPDIFVGNEARHLQHQQYQPAPAEPAAMAALGETRYRLTAGTEIDRRRLSGFCDRQGRLWRGLARAKDLQRRRHPGATKAEPVMIRTEL